MFDKEYSFRGVHADRVNKLTAKFDDNNKLFDRNLDVYLSAPIIGFIYGQKSALDKSGDSTKIFPEQLLREKDNLAFNYRLILLLDRDHEPDFDKRVDKAFRLFGTELAAPDEELYEAYVRGGVDILYEKLMDTAHDSDDYVKNLYDFVEEFDARYNEAVSTDSILDLCRLARS